MKPEELIVAVEVDSVEGKQWFRKVGTRAAVRPGPRRVQSGEV